jgi:hypothetical protein
MSMHARADLHSHSPLTNSFSYVFQRNLSSPFRHSERSEESLPSSERFLGRGATEE